jgi:hypothetical protein
VVVVDEAHHINHQVATDQIEKFTTRGLYESYSDNDIMAQIMAQEADELNKLLPLLEQTRRKKDQEQANQEKMLLVEGEMLEGKRKVTVGALPNMETLKGELKTKLSLTKAIDLLEVWDEEFQG